MSILHFQQGHVFPCYHQKTDNSIHQVVGKWLGVTQGTAQIQECNFHSCYTVVMASISFMSRKLKNGLPLLKHLLA